MIKALYLLIISFLIISFGYLPRAITPKPALNIFVWGDFFDEKTLSLFTKETGIPIHVHYYTSNEELLLKLEKTNGAGYDLLFPSDYTVPLLKEKGLLQPLDHSRLPIASIDPSLLGLPFDPENSTLPYFWEIYGITWKGDLDPLFHGHQKVVMIQDPTEAFSLASLHLGSGAPETYQFDPLSASIIPYFFRARSITCAEAG